MSKERGSPKAVALRAAVMAVVLLSAGLAGCTRTSPVPAAEPEPPAPNAAEQLLGVWRNTEGSYGEDDYVVGKTHRTITITETRFQDHVARIRNDGTLEHFWVDNNGNWAVSGTTLTLDSRQYDENDEPYVASFETEFYLADADTLLLKDWGQDPSHEFLRYTRVPDALPESIVGTWQLRLPLADEDEGYRVTLTINADGSMAYHSVSPGDWDYTLSAQWTHDVVNRLIVMSDVASVGPTDVSSLYTEGDGTPRLAYVATHVAGQIIVSGWWREPGGYQHEGSPFGAYDHIFVRDEPEP